MYHKLVMVGYLGGDPEMRFTPSGTSVTNFSVATTRKWKNQDGSQGEETVWFRVAAWGNLADVCDKYLHKGSLVLVEGMLKPIEAYTKNDGTPGANYQMHANLVRFLDRAGETRTSQEEPREKPQAKPSLNEDDIPF